MNFGTVAALVFVAMLGGVVGFELATARDSEALRLSTTPQALAQIEITARHKIYGVGFHDGKEWERARIGRERFQEQHP